jgi:cysteine-rich repeat protein
MSGICINISGCLTAAVIHGAVQCVACNTTNNFQISLNYTCNCVDGLILVNGSCIPECGDGMVYLDEACDDGNTMNGDGCSSTCTIEKYYNCKNGSTTHKSDCYYANRNIKLSLINTYKSTKDNIGYFIFAFSPSPTILNKIDFTSAATFAVTPKHQIMSISFSASQLTI